MDEPINAENTPLKPSAPDDEIHDYVSFGEPEEDNKTLIDSKKLTNIIESFITNGSKKLSSFLRKKTVIHSSSINTGLFESMEDNSNTRVTLAFQVGADGLFGLIIIDFILLHAIINLLYGGKVVNDEPIMQELGKSGIKIASKVSEIFLLEFQDALNEHLKTDIKLLNLSSSLYSVFNQKREKYYKFVFNLSLETISGTLQLIIPEHVFDNITLSSTTKPLDTHDASLEAYHFDDELKNELIDLKITISAVLPDIALLVKDVVNLRAGDIIPIGDPTLVYVIHNQKKLFSATVGQSNSRRLVKITDTI